MRIHYFNTGKNYAGGTNTVEFGTHLHYTCLKEKRRK